MAALGPRKENQKKLLAQMLCQVAPCCAAAIIIIAGGKPARRGRDRVARTRLEAINGLNQKNIFQKKAPAQKQLKKALPLVITVCGASVCVCRVCVQRVCAAACINMSTAAASASDSFSHLPTLPPPQSFSSLLLFAQTAAAYFAPAGGGTF